jgi:DNA mismatch endonuclease Vsr
MADKLTPDRRSRNMGNIRSKDTTPEIIVRKVTHRLGYRFRLHRKDLPGKPDLVFPARKKSFLFMGVFGISMKTLVAKSLGNQNQEETIGFQSYREMSREIRNT